jgi:hypothetical protein
MDSALVHRVKIALRLAQEPEALSRVGSEFLLDLPEPPDAAADG